MDIAKCRLNGKAYNIWQFLELSEQDLEKLKHSLICDECLAPAFFRKKSKNNRAACFYSRPHNEDCEQAKSTPPPTVDEIKDAKDVHQILVSDTELNVDFTQTLSAEMAENGDPNDLPAGSRPKGSSSTPERHIIEPPLNRIANRGLKSLLNYLIKTPDFPDDDTLIHTDGKYARKAKDIFRKFEVAEVSKRPFFFWGMITGVDKKFEWLNTGGVNSVSIPISKFNHTLKRVLNTNDPSDLVGAHCIVWGWCNPSRKAGSNRLFIDTNLNNPDYIFIKLNN